MGTILFSAVACWSETRWVRFCSAPWHVGLGQGGYDSVQRGGTLVWDKVGTILFSTVSVAKQPAATL